MARRANGWAQEALGAQSALRRGRLTRGRPCAGTARRADGRRDGSVRERFCIGAAPRADRPMLTRPRAVKRARA
eukprot:10565387-Lingulodinium_polyedra.AAC.1